jgi:hypothetical protein
VFKSFLSQTGFLRPVQVVGWYKRCAQLKLPTSEGLVYGLLRMGVLLGSAEEARQRRRRLKRRVMRAYHSDIPAIQLPNTMKTLLSRLRTKDQQACQE